MRLLKARRSEMHDDGRQGRSLAGTALVNESIEGKSRSFSMRHCNQLFRLLDGVDSTNAGNVKMLRPLKHRNFLLVNRIRVTAKIFNC